MSHAWLFRVLAVPVTPSQAYIYDFRVKRKCNENEIAKQRHPTTG
jgi:hypothetical protein